MSTDVLLIEDDEGDAVIVTALLELDGGLDLVWVRTLGDGRDELTRSPKWVLLDLGLPDAEGVSAVRRVVEMAPDSAVIVLTGLDDERRGLEALAAGAQDYLVKGQVDGRALLRSMRYALERKRADRAYRLLRESELRAAENARLERGLLPHPLLTSGSLECVTWYQTGGENSLLGGDFFDVVELADGSIRCVVGDVCGHGTEEAALGVRLRAAWRTLVLAGVGFDESLASLERVLTSEQSGEGVFVTVCDVHLAPDLSRARLALAGHPPPVVSGGGRVAFAGPRPGPPLGVVDGASWPTASVELGQRWTLFIYTDGLVEGLDEENLGAHARLGSEGLVSILTGLGLGEQPLETTVRSTIAEAERRNGSSLVDDVAVVALSPNHR